MRFRNGFIVLLLLSLVWGGISNAQEYHSACNDSPDVYRLDVLEVISGRLTLTEVAIGAKDKSVCVNGLPAMKNENTDSVDLFFEFGLFQCHQTGTEERIAAAKLSDSAYRIVGHFSRLRDNVIILENCQFEPF
ncbi:hypothetical protein [Marimonas lutisalis]|uniref:hypothetical protein n=1 Tax=Marimonas lutisalis TaxID=2545756 RepID=UPI0010F698E8|nr:hypothetical protein [Marimonas lutisalis]